MAVKDFMLKKTSDNTVEVRNLRNRNTSPATFLTGATVTARLLVGGSPVSGVPDPITFSEVSGYTAFYRGAVPDSADIDVGDDLVLVITADAGTGLLRTWSLDGGVEEGP